MSTKTESLPLAVHDGKVYEPIENPLYRGWVESKKYKIQAAAPKYQWLGRKIPYDLWCQVVWFMKWTQTKFKAEAHITFFYHPETGEWAAWAFAQEPAGMTVRLLDKHPTYAEDRKRFGRGWIQFGSVHHHCEMKAFASQTDVTDEADRDGLHVTIGEVSKDTVDIHCRQTFDGCVTETNLLYWIDLPSWLVEVPEHLRYSFLKAAIYSSPETKFPVEWMQRIIERTQVHAVHGYGYGHGGGHMHWEQGGEDLPGFTQAPGQATGTGAESEKARNEVAGNGTLMTRSSGTIPWEQSVQNKLRALTTRLSLTLLEALKLLASFPDKTWSTEDIEMRRVLTEEMKKESIPTLYAESCLERMITADRIAARP